MGRGRGFAKGRQYEPWCVGCESSSPPVTHARLPVPNIPQAGSASAAQTGGTGEDQHNGRGCAEMPSWETLAVGRDLGLILLRLVEHNHRHNFACVRGGGREWPGKVFRRGELASCPSRARVTP